MSNSIKQAIQYAIVFAIGGLFLFLVFNKTDWQQLWSILSNANYYWIAVGMFISWISHIIRAYRATMLYEAMSYKVSVANSYHAVIIGYFMNYLIPRGGEISRAASVFKTNQLALEKGLGSIVTERLVDLIMMLFVLAIVFVFQVDLILSFLQKQTSNTSGTNSSSVNIIYIIGVVLLSVIFIFVFRKKITAFPLVLKVIDKLKGFASGLTSITKIKRPILFIVLSVCIWVCYILMMYFCLFALPGTSSLNFLQCLTVFALGTIGVIIPAPGAGAGTYHFAVTQGLLLFGVAETEGTAYATLVHGAQMIMFLILGVISSVIVLRKTKKQHA